MVMLHSVDPGVKYYALAEWDRLGACLIGVAVFDLTPAVHVGDAHLVIERAVVYKTGTVRARTSDIEDLLIATGRIIERYGSHTLVRPAEWKGQVPKKIHHARILEKLTLAEKELLKSLTKGALKHIMDAIGIGLRFLGRM